VTTEPQPDPYPWLPAASVLDWLQISSSSELTTVAEAARRAAGAYCERMRPDLVAVTVDLERVFLASDDIVMAGLISCARLYARRSTPTGLASFGEFGASDILRLDPDVARLLGTGRYAPPVIG
jgi:hypothetical protein